MPKTDRQQLKDILWRLDDETEKMTSEISRRTGDAWKAAVEGENVLRHLKHAHNMARDLESRILAVIDDVEQAAEKKS